MDLDSGKGRSAAPSATRSDLFYDDGRIKPAFDAPVVPHHFAFDLFAAGAMPMDMPRYAPAIGSILSTTAPAPPPTVPTHTITAPQPPQPPVPYSHSRTTPAQVSDFVHTMPKTTTKNAKRMLSDVDPDYDEAAAQIDAGDDDDDDVDDDDADYRPDGDGYKSSSVRSAAAPGRRVRPPSAPVKKQRISRPTAPNYVVRSSTDTPHAVYAAKAIGGASSLQLPADSAAADALTATRTAQGDGTHVEYHRVNMSRYGLDRHYTKNLVCNGRHGVEVALKPEMFAKLEMRAGHTLMRFDPQATASQDACEQVEKNILAHEERSKRGECGACRKQLYMRVYPTHVGEPHWVRLRTANLWTLSCPETCLSHAVGSPFICFNKTIVDHLARLGHCSVSSARGGRQSRAILCHDCRARDLPTALMTPDEYLSHVWHGCSASATSSPRNFE
jgi:hypothetical protein